MAAADRYLADPAIAHHKRAVLATLDEIRAAVLVDDDSGAALKAGGLGYALQIWATEKARVRSLDFYQESLAERLASGRTAAWTP